MQSKINMKVDTTAFDQEIEAFEKHLRRSYSIKAKLAEDIDMLDPDDRHYTKMKSDLNDRLYKMYDKIEDLETKLIEVKAKKSAVEADQITGDNIYKVLICFERLYSVMNDEEKRDFMKELISEVNIYENRQPNGQWLKDIKFKLPIIEEDMKMSLDNNGHVETILLLSQRKS